MRELGLMPDVASAFGEDAFGRRAEAAARFFGTPKYILGQTALIRASTSSSMQSRSWCAWDAEIIASTYIKFSTQAAYAAPLILLAQTRQVDRDKAASDQLEAHREEVAKNMQEREAALKAETDELKALLQSNTQLTQQDKELTERIEMLTREIHTRSTAAQMYPAKKCPRPARRSSLPMSATRLPGRGRARPAG